MEIQKFRIERIQKDGNCLFNAISLYMYGFQTYHKQIREEAVQYVKEHWNELKDHIVESDPAKQVQNQSQYCARMEKSGTYGTSVELLAIAETQNLNIYVHTSNEDVKGEEFTPSEKPTRISKRDYGQNVHLLLIGNKESGHFELLTPASENNPSNKVPEERTKCGEEGNKNSKEGESMENRARRQQWTEAEYREIVWCHYYILETTGASNINEMYKLWRDRNPKSRSNLNPNTLANQRRYVVANKMTEVEKERILREVKQHIAESRKDEVETSTQKGIPGREMRSKKQEEEPEGEAENESQDESESVG